MSEKVSVENTLPESQDTARELNQSTQSSSQNDDLEQPLPKPEEDVPPDGGYGWVCVACNFWINGCTWGINSTYAIFLAYYLSHDYFPNTSPLAYAFIGGLSISIAMLAAPLATKCIAILGTRITIYIGVFFQTLALIGASFATKKYQLILAQGFCFGLGMGFIFVGSVNVIPQWFSKRRSIANAICASGSGLGGLMWSLATQTMIDNLGLPWAFRILGILSCAVNLTGGTILKDRNKQVGARNRSFDMSLLKRPEFLLVQAWSWLSMFGYVTVLFSLPAYARQIGLSAHDGAITGAIFNLGQMVGRPFVGLASDRWGRINCAAFFTALCGIFCIVFWIPTEVAPSQLGLILFFSIVGGGLAGTFWATVPAVEAEVVGMRDLGSALSWTWLIMVLPVTCAEPIALEIRRTGAPDFVYIYAQIFCALSYISGGVVLWVLRGWKIGELEELERIKKREQRLLEQRSTAVRTTDEKVEPGDVNSSSGEREVPLTRELSAASAREQGWNYRVLLRRMMKPKIV